MKPNRRKVLAVIGARKVAPTLLELAAEALDSPNSAAAAHHVGALERLGYVTRTPGAPRSLAITDAGRRALESTV